MTKMLVVALSAAVLAGGCSITLQPRPAQSTFGYAEQKCSTSSKYWIADALIAGVGASAVIGGRLYADSAPDHETAAYSLAGLGGVLAIAYLASAGNGRSWANKCSGLSTARTASR